MALVSQEVVGLYNGVSQQPPTLRMSSQCAVQENCLGSLVDGLIKRPNTDHVAMMLGSSSNQYAFFHNIDRDETEKYIISITGEASSPIEIWTLDGQKCVVQYGTLDEDLVFRADDSVKAYATVPYPKWDIRAVTIADYTIIVNTTVVPSMLPSYEQGKVPEVIAWVKQTQAGCKFKVTVDQTYAEVRTGDGMATDEIVTKLTNVLKSNPTLQVDVISSVFRIRRKDGADFTFSMTDGWGERLHTVAAKGVIQKFTDLPPKCWHGTKVQIKQDEQSEFSDYYVEFQGSNNTRSPFTGGGTSVRDGDGVWEESRGWNLLNQFNPRTMPHRLVRMPGGTFVFAPIIWEERKVGDEESAPTPSFVGSPIDNVFFYRNRLGFLSRDNMVLSKASEFFDLWPTTVLDVLDDDPIDVAVGSTSVAHLRHAVGFEKNLMLVGDQSQFIVSSGGGTMTPKSVVIDHATTFASSADAHPAPCGSNLYFLSPGQTNSRLREFLVQPDTLTTDAADVTAHCPNYLPTGAATITPVSALDMLFIHFISQPDTLYVYHFYWQGNEKPQSAWSKWIFPYDILHVAAFNTELYLIADAQIEQHLEKIRLEPSPSKNLPTPPYRVYLDRHVLLQGKFDAGLNRTTWVLPYADWGGDFTIIYGGQPVPGPYARADEYHISATGDYATGGGAWVGLNYTSRYRFSPWFIKDGEGKVAMDGRLQHKWTSLVYDETGYFRVETTPRERATRIKEVGPFTTLIKGESKFLVNGQSLHCTVDIVSDSYLPFKIQKATHEGVFTKRARSV